MWCGRPDLPTGSTVLDARLPPVHPGNRVARCLAGALGATRDPDGHPLPNPDPSPTSLQGAGLWGGRFPRGRTPCETHAVPADVPRAPPGADRVGDRGDRELFSGWTAVR